MRATSAIGRQLEVLFFALCGLSFWVVLFVLIYLLGGLVMSSRMHAQAQFEAPSGPLWLDIRLAS